MNGHGQKFTRGMERLIAALLTNDTITSAASEANIGEKTARRWLQVPAFRAAYAKARSQLIEDTVADVQRAASAAVRVLKEIAEDNTKSASARVSAASRLLEISFRGAEVIDLESRVRALEAARNGAKP